MTNTELLEVKGPGPDWDELQSPPAEALATPDHLEGQDDLDLHKAQGHLLLALMGKRVLRPGGMELTRCMIEALAVGPEDQVVELAPGLGATAALALACMPLTYTGVDHDPRMVDQLRARLEGPGRRFLLGHAAHTGLPGSSVDKVYGEAMLTMHADHRKREIIREAYRILKPGGSYAIHELGLTPPAITATDKATIHRELAQAIRVNARPLTAAEWEELLVQEGFRVRWQHAAAMRLLEPGRMIADEGLLRTLRIAWNIVRLPAARGRILTMRRVFRKHRKHINAVAFIAVKA